MAQRLRQLDPDASPLALLGAEIRRRRMGIGLSQAELAGRLFVSKDLIGKIEKAERRPSNHLAAALDEALQADGQLSVLAEYATGGRGFAYPRADTTSSSAQASQRHTSTAVDSLAHIGRATGLWASDAAGETRSEAGVVNASALALWWLVTAPSAAESTETGSGHVGLNDVARVEDAVRRFEAADHRYGGATAGQAAARYIARHVAPLLQGGMTNEVGRRLYGVSAVLTYKVGAMAYDTHAHGVARRYFAQALDLAHASGDRALGGKVLALMSHQENFLGNFAIARDLARAAQTGAAGSASRRVVAMYCAMEARALASLGDARDCRRTLAEAERMFGQSVSGDDPPWISYFDHAELHDEHAHCLRDLGESREAVIHADQALATSSDLYQRSRTFCQLIKATAILDQREPEEAASVALAAVEKAHKIRSSRVQAYMRDTLVRFTGHDTLPAVARLRSSVRKSLVQSVDSDPGTPM